MQIVGLALLLVVISFGFEERTDTVISAFDYHAAIMVLGGSFAAILASSSARNGLRTLLYLREILPGLGVLPAETAALEAERTQLAELWLSGRRAQAVTMAENSRFPEIKATVDLIVQRAPREAVQAAFTDLRHATLERWQPAIGNWELLAKLAPSFGMVGTITGMIQLFQNMGEDTNLGAAISLALLATLYGVAFGAGVAGPIGHFLRQLLDERLGALERCEQGVGGLIARANRDAAVGG